ncbi:MAG: DUF1080 domain-containing protein [Acidobacteriota bacterium]
MRRPILALMAILIIILMIVSGSARRVGYALHASGQNAPRGTGIEPIVADDRAGFLQIFDGKTLNGWDGDPGFWRVENGELVGESTIANPLKVNTFVIWRGGRPSDFELKVEYRISSTNSGIQYRSVELPAVAKWVLKGYQADIDFQNAYTGQLYEERGRGFLALRGQMTHLLPGRKQVIASLANSEELRRTIKAADWNRVHIIARGNILVHILNDQLMSQVVDDDEMNRSMSGLIGFQMHVGAPMKVQFRNIWLKAL